MVDSTRGHTKILIAMNIPIDLYDEAKLNF